MSEILDFLTDFIRIDIFVGFGWYSMLYFLLKWVVKDKTVISDFDKSAVQLVVYGGFIWLTLWLTKTGFFYLESEINRVKYSGHVGWIEAIFWFLLTQLYRINPVRRFLVFRILISLLFLLTVERFVILLTLFHRDYLPDTWGLFSDFEDGFFALLLVVLIKIGFFLLTVSLYRFVMGKR